jgi:hypothetical protein
MYGKSWERYPIERGEIWSFNGSKISVADITESIPDYLTTADMVYCDPPWALNNTNMFNGKSGKSYINDFNEFLHPFFDAIDKINPDCCYIEIGKENFGLMLKGLNSLFDVVQYWNITYYGKNPSFLLRGGSSATDNDFTGKDDAQTPYLAINAEKPRIVCDMCMGKGLTAIAALDSGCRFVGTELIKQKLASGIEILKKKGYEFKKEI